MKKPWYQKFLTRYLLVSFASVVFVSSLVDIANNLGFITTKVAFVGTAVVVLLMFFLYTSIKKNPITWITEDGSKIKIKSLGVIPFLSAASVIVALWLPFVMNILSTPDLFVPQKIADPNFTIVMANIDGPDQEKYQITNSLLDRLRNEAGKEDKVIIIDETITEQEGSTKARGLGEKYDADIVVWGWYGITNTDVFMSIHIELMLPVEDIPLQSDPNMIQVSSRGDLNNFSAQVMFSENISTLISLVSGIKKYKAGDCAGAAVSLEQSVANPQIIEMINNPLQVANLYYFAGKCRLETNHYDEAVIDLKKAIDNNEFHASAYFQLGNTYATTKEWDNATINYSKSIDIYSKYPLAYYNRAIVYKELGDYQAAIDDFVKCRDTTQDAVMKKAAQDQLQELGIFP